MAWLDIVWDLEDEPEGNVRHLAEHGVSQDEVAEVLAAQLAMKRADPADAPSPLATLPVVGCWPWCTSK